MALRGEPRALTRAIGLINRSLLVRYSDADLVRVRGKSAIAARVSYPRVDACLYTGLMLGRSTSLDPRGGSGYISVGPNGWNVVDRLK